MRRDAGGRPVSSLDDFRARARAWLEAAAPVYGHAARRGLAPAADLALARRYQQAKYAAGFAGINWPVAMGGQGLGNLEKIAFDTEEMPHGMPVHYFSVSLGMPIPVLMKFGTDPAFVRERVVRALSGDEIWCQLFSEPAAGSDLAGIRLRASRDGNGWRLDGQKLWTSWAQYSDYGIILARTDPTVPKHRGLTYFWVDMHAPGVTVRPVKLAGGGSQVNEVFFENVPVADGQRMGAVGEGFAVALATLMIERHHASDSAAFGPSLDLFVALARAVEVNGRPAVEDGRVRSVIARTRALRSALDAITARAKLALEAGREPGPEGALNKLVAARSRQRLSELAIDLMGTAGLAFDREASVRADWVQSWLNAPTSRIAGGADEMLLNTIAERILGLPQDHRPDKGVPFNRIPG